MCKESIGVQSYLIFHGKITPNHVKILVSMLPDITVFKKICIIIGKRMIIVTLPNEICT